eukprot:CAMPEP_0115766738 /NCGR_PEP_ID=MMETSP0272-20121206/103314_1 /TAXON_ID=71861 /ORGANISM="Scrippsiella trochoidea, Strain CCMP3099" /LENGTH=47 /DNA_ID= /DNA_START= /DNA_END= /DNA_ORIENTATION=
MASLAVYGFIATLTHASKGAWQLRAAGGTIFMVGAVMLGLCFKEDQS